MARLNFTPAHCWAKWRRDRQAATQASSCRSVLAIFLEENKFTALSCNMKNLRPVERVWPDCYTQLHTTPPALANPFLQQYLFDDPAASDHRSMSAVHSLTKAVRAPLIRWPKHEPGCRLSSSLFPTGTLSLFTLTFFVRSVVATLNAENFFFNMYIAS